jgi:hypothetical protein
VDESPVSPNGDGIVSAEADYVNSFTTTDDYGTDGAGKITYTMALNGSNLDTGLFALDPNASNGKGAQIQLHIDTTTGVVTGEAGGTTYFTIKNNGSKVSIEQNENLWHPDAGPAGATPDHHDDAAILDAAANTLVLRQTITDADGDSDSVDLDLSKNVFKIEDDGPIANAVTGTPTELIVDESVIGAPDGKYEATAD